MPYKIEGREIIQYVGEEVMGKQSFEEAKLSRYIRVAEIIKEYGGSKRVSVIQSDTLNFRARNDLPRSLQFPRRGEERPDAEVPTTVCDLVEGEWIFEKPFPLSYPPHEIAVELLGRPVMSEEEHDRLIEQEWRKIRFDLFTFGL